MKYALKMPNHRVFRSLITAEFAAKQKELRQLLVSFKDDSMRASRATEYLSAQTSDLERDALWWTCVHQRSLPSFYDAFMKRYEDQETVYFGQDDNEIGDCGYGDCMDDMDDKTVVIVCPDYSHLATMMRGKHATQECAFPRRTFS